eukprot:SAG31_NODE_36779_length_310_cov_0.966825_2_plen_63_part_01
MRVPPRSFLPSAPSTLLQAEDTEPTPEDVKRDDGPKPTMEEREKAMLGGHSMAEVHLHLLYRA